MTLNDYQQAAGHHAFYPAVGQNLTYPLLGLAGEAGELCNRFKKILRERRDPTAEDMLALGDELGDVLWYVAAVAQELAFTLEEVAQHNLLKLERRRTLREAQASLASEELAAGKAVAS